jgi:hypothetical protein
VLELQSKCKFLETRGNDLKARINVDDYVPCKSETSHEGDNAFGDIKQLIAKFKREREG